MLAIGRVVERRRGTLAVGDRCVTAKTSRSTVSAVDEDYVPSRWRELGIWTGTARRLVIECEQAAYELVALSWPERRQGQDPTVEGRAYWKLEAARQLAVVTLDWVATAADVLGLERPSPLEHLDLVRNILEHRDEYLNAWANHHMPRSFDRKREWSGDSFVTLFPGEDPFSAAYVTSGRGVHLTRSVTADMALDWLDTLATAVAAYSAQLGDLMTPAPPRPVFEW